MVFNMKLDLITESYFSLEKLVKIQTANLFKLK